MYRLWRSSQHSSLLREKSRRAIYGDSPSMRRLVREFNRSSGESLPVARNFGELTGKYEEKYLESVRES